MRPLSAFDAISPAFARTRLFLFAPFRAGRTWKLAATGYLTMAGVFFLPVPLIYLAALPVLPLPEGAKLAIVLVTLALTALFTFVFHVCSRLGFAFFDLVLNGPGLVAPAWRLYGPVSRRWSLCKVVFGCVAVVAMAAPAVAYVRRLIPEFAALTAKPNVQPSPQFFLAIFSGYFLLLFGVLFFFAIASLANDFVVPSLALEEVSLAAALRRLGLLVRHEPGQFALYALTKFLLGFAGYFAVSMALQLTILILGAVFALVGGLVGYGIHLLGVPLPVLWVAATVVGIPVMLGTIIYGSFLGMGTLATFLQAYLLYFLGGRYVLLGERLEPSNVAARATEHLNP